MTAGTAAHTETRTRTALATIKRLSAWRFGGWPAAWFVGGVGAGLFGRVVEVGPGSTGPNTSTATGQPAAATAAPNNSATPPAAPGGNSPHAYTATRITRVGRPKVEQPTDLHDWRGHGDHEMSWHKQRPPAPDNQAKTATTEEWALRNDVSGRVTLSRPREAALRSAEGWTPVRRYVTDWEEA